MIRTGLDLLGPGFVGVQSELSLARPEGLATVAACRDAGLAFHAWAPLGGAGRARRWVEVPAVRSLARDRACTPAELALAWVATTDPAIVPWWGPAGRRRSPPACAPSTSACPRTSGRP